MGEFFRNVTAFFAVVLTAYACATMGPAMMKAAAPVAAEAAKQLVESVTDYVEAKGKEPTRVNCEEEWHPSDKELLILCTAKYRK